ncbi:MAG: hypothetical protein M1834_002455 [Cirrosporium novae-zelandiae]|nr:MAG: hypothetical protein M1834_002455 [Cirrosporium novae-zelandiae]
MSNIKQPLHATPSTSFTTPPLTPPPTDKKKRRLILHIVEEIKARKVGYHAPIKPWATYSLETRDFKNLLKVLQSDESLWGFVIHKLRYDYFPSVSLFVIRMLTAVHEKLVLSITRELELQLSSIARSGSRSAAFAQEIEPGGSTSIDFGDSEYGKHDPDAQFGHSQAAYPGVVIEVSYSQKQKDLARLADDYILGSDGNIRVVINLSVEYRGSKKATLSVWRSRILQNDAGEGELVAVPTIAGQIIRDENGNPTDDAEAGLHLQLQDFAPEALADMNEPLRDPIHISANTLCMYIERAENRAAVIKRERDVIQQERDAPSPTRPWVRKRRRHSTPPEELEQEREKRFQEDEDRASVQAAQDDSSYKASSVSGAESG